MEITVVFALIYLWVNERPSQDCVEKTCENEACPSSSRGWFSRKTGWRRKWYSFWYSKYLFLLMFWLDFLSIKGNLILHFKLIISSDNILNSVSSNTSSSRETWKANQNNSIIMNFRVSCLYDFAINVLDSCKNATNKSTSTILLKLSWRSP